jgi:hypothetical protein
MSRFTFVLLAISLFACAPQPTPMPSRVKAVSKKSSREADLISVLLRLSTPITIYSKRRIKAYFMKSRILPVTRQTITKRC